MLKVYLIVIILIITKYMYQLFYHKFISICEKMVPVIMCMRFSTTIFHSVFNKDFSTLSLC